jgi:acyl-CoA reductase-like NAD-dependent aldehyde dehydrogenase
MRNSSMTASTIETKHDLSAEPQDTWGALIGGRWKTAGPSISVRSPFDDAVIAKVRFGTASEIEEAISVAVQSFEATRHLPSWRRAEILERVSSMIREDREDFARTIALEAGKPIRSARIEVDRAIFTFKIAAEEAKRIYGEIVPLDWLPGAEACVAHIRRVPRGPVVGISPFNFPLNLVAHKVAPALAAGNPIILRPASQTPVSALKLGKIIVAAGWPPAAISVIPSAVKDASQLVEDERIKFLTFTGSAEVGWSLKKRAGSKPVTLELGGNAATIVHRDAAVSHAAARVAWGSFTFSGQTCISVQRVYVHADIYSEFKKHLLPEVQKLKVGNPLDEETDIGPVIDPAAAERIETWLREATDEGAKIATGGTHRGNLWEPTIVESVSESMKVSCKEVFGPVVCLSQYTDVREALDRANHSDFGLQAGLFTESLELVERAFDQLDVGGLVVNDVSTFRMDHMPYGGVKQSGLGREGLRYAIQEMTEAKLLAVNHAVSHATEPAN